MKTAHLEIGAMMPCWTSGVDLQKYKASIVDTHLLDFFWDAIVDIVLSLINVSASDANSTVQKTTLSVILGTGPQGSQVSGWLLLL